MSETTVTPAQTNQPNCPRCGTPLPSGVLTGLCPACLLKIGAQTDTVTEAKQSGFSPPNVAELAPLFPQLEILELIGKGGMGAVYKARQKQLDRVVALKILPPGIGEDPAFAERFTREARALAKLNHPGIVTLYEFGNVGQASRLSQTSNNVTPQSGIAEKMETGAPPVLRFYFLMEFVDGVNLRQLLHAGRVSAREALAIVPQICDALQFAHDQGIVHRDIKPENILLDRRGRVKVADFGLAKIVGSESALGVPPSGGPDRLKPELQTLTDAGKIMGTPQYMSPEQIQAPGEVDHRADIYALGVVFYQMLTGELPGKKLEPPSNKVSIDVRLDEVVLRALELRPELRYQQASDFKTQVETIASSPFAGSSASRTQASRYHGVDYRSKATLFGLPLVHVTTGLDPATGRARVAKGIIAIGGLAKGVFAFGGMAMGGIAFGGGAIGVVAIGGGAFGLISFGGLAIGLLAALGGGAIGFIAAGGGALGYLTFGGGTIGVHAYDAVTRDPVAERFFLPWAKTLFANMQWINFALLVPLLLVGVGVPLWLQRRQDESGSGQPSDSTRSTTNLPPFSFAIAMTYAGALVLSGLCELLAGRVPGRWVIASFLIAGVVSLVAAFVAKHHGSSRSQQTLRRIAAISGFIAALPVMGFAIFFLHAMGQQSFKWNPSASEFVVVVLSWLGTLLLPLSFWRLSRGGARRVGMTLLALLFFTGLGLAVWERSRLQQVAQRLEVEQQANVIEAERIAKLARPVNEGNDVQRKNAGPQAAQLIASKTKLDELLTHYTEFHPEVIRLRQQIRMLEESGLAEPTYEGRKLSSWLSEIDYGPESRSRATKAIEAMGTNVIPFLLVDLGSSDCFQIKHDPADSRSLDERVRHAVWAFDALGAAAKPAIPELEQLLEVTPGYVPSALAGIGRDALPTLMKALTNEVFWVRDNAAAAIANGIHQGKFSGHDAMAALPVALSNLSYTNATNGLYEVNTRSRAEALIQAIKSDPILESLETKR